MADADRETLFDTAADEAESARLDAKAEADLAAGRFVSHAKVVKWLQSWGTPNKLLRPTPDTE